MGELPPGEIARVDQVEASAGDTVDRLVVTFREEAAKHGRSAAMVSAAWAMTHVIDGGGRNQVVDALVVAISRLCPDED